jgi:hypothetical protein
MIYLNNKLFVRYLNGLPSHYQSCDKYHLNNELLRVHYSDVSVEVTIRFMDMSGIRVTRVRPIIEWSVNQTAVCLADDH